MRRGGRERLGRNDWRSDDVPDALVWLDDGNAHDENFRAALPPGLPGRRRPRRGARAVLRIVGELETIGGA